MNKIKTIVNSSWFKAAAAGAVHQPQGLRVQLRQARPDGRGPGRIQGRLENRRLHLPEPRLQRDLPH